MKTAATTILALLLLQSSVRADEDAKAPSHNREVDASELEPVVQQLREQHRSVQIAEEHAPPPGEYQLSLYGEGLLLKPQKVRVSKAENGDLSVTMIMGGHSITSKLQLASAGTYRESRNYSICFQSLSGPSPYTLVLHGQIPLALPPNAHFSGTAVEISQPRSPQPKKPGEFRPLTHPTAIVGRFVLKQIPANKAQK